MKTLTIAEAESMKLVPYAGPYLEHEIWMMEDALRDVAHNGRDLAFVVNVPPASLDIYIQPNKFPSAYPYVPLSSVLSREHQRAAKETFDEVEDSELRAEAIHREARKATEGLRRAQRELLNRQSIVPFVQPEEVNPGPPPPWKNGWDANGSPILDGGVPPVS